MLVYANYLKAIGQNAKGAFLRGIGGWLKEQLGYGIMPNSIVMQGEFCNSKDTANPKVKVVLAKDENQELYSWVFTKFDDIVKGRTWKTEIGLNIVGDTYELSCVLTTEELSTLVFKPVQASIPRFIRYIVNNIKQLTDVDFDPSIPGISLKRVGDSIDSYCALGYYIDDPQRAYPIVLVSPTRDGEYLIDAELLQDTLVGLAQVVEVDKGYNSYDMCEELGKSLSAWDGAVNVIQMPTSSGYIRSRVFLSEEIKAWGDIQKRKSNIIAWVTNNTNLPRFRKRIRPEGVMMLAIQQNLAERIKRHQNLNEEELRNENVQLAKILEEQNQWAKLLETEIEELEAKNQRTTDELEEKKLLLSKERQQTINFKAELKKSGEGVPKHDVIKILETLVEKKDPTPPECLEIIETVYGDHCEILESAKTNAEDACFFSQGRHLLNYLIRLVTEYRSFLLSGKGDSEAKHIFGNNGFAAKESETVMLNSNLRSLRMFEYQGHLVEMFRHLKIGTADDQTKTIRVHFYWDKEKEKIIIGYCGKHLPVSSH